MICLKCEEDKPTDSFEHQKNRPNPRKICKVCRQASRDKTKEALRHRTYMKERRKSNPVIVRQNWERCTYGVCKEDLGEQVCRICGSSKRLHIDHDHTTGKVRGLLCHYCNIGIGMFKDKQELLEKAIQYLKDGPHFELDKKIYS